LFGFGAITSLFISKKSGMGGGGDTSAGGAQGRQGEDGDDWTSLTKTIVKKPLSDLAEAARAPSPASVEDEAKDPAEEGGKKLRKNRLTRANSVESDKGTKASGGAAMPILTLSDMNRFAIKKKDAGSQQHAAAVPALPTPGEGGFVSHRDNLKLLEMRRVEEAKRAAQSGLGIGAGKKAYQGIIKPRAGGMEDSFLRDDNTIFLSGTKR
jgi:hypothetical protein